MGVGQIFEIRSALALNAHTLGCASRRHGVNHGRGLGRDVRFSALRRGQCQIEPVVLIDAAGARLQIERGESWMVAILVERPEDVEGVACILTAEIGAPIGVRRKFEIELTRYEPASRA